MVRISARFVWLVDHWGVALPTNIILPNTVRPTVADKVDANGVLAGVEPDDPDVQDLWCDCLVPLAYLNEKTGRVDPQLVVALYDQGDEPVAVGAAEHFAEPPIGP